MLKPTYIIVIAVLLLASCQGERKQHEKTELAVSIAPLRYIVGRVAGDAYRIIVVVPPQSGPETYEPSPGDIAAVSRASLFFINGNIEFEKTIIRKITKGESKVVDLSKGIRLIASDDEGHSHHAGIDPHYWLNPADVKVMAANVLAALIQKDPEGEGAYRHHFSLFARELDSMGTVIGEMLKTRRRDLFAIFHPSLAYLAGQYGLAQLAVEYEGKEPSMLHLVRVAEAARAAGIRTVFCQAQVDRHLTEALAHEIGAQVVDIDPLREDLIQNIKDITVKLSNSLHE